MYHMIDHLPCTLRICLLVRRSQLPSHILLSAMFRIILFMVFFLGTNMEIMIGTIPCRYHEYTCPSSRFCMVYHPGHCSSKEQRCCPSRPSNIIHTDQLKLHEIFYSQKFYWKEITFPHLYQNMESIYTSFPERAGRRSWSTVRL